MQSIDGAREVEVAAEGSCGNARTQRQHVLETEMVSASLAGKGTVQFHRKAALEPDMVKFTI